MSDLQFTASISFAVIDVFGKYLLISYGNISTDFCLQTL